MEDPGARLHRVTIPPPACLHARIAVLWTGLKGAVPILLGAFIVEAGAPGAERLYQVIFVVVAFSVVVQGGTVPWLLRRLRAPLRTIEPEPWTPGWNGSA